VVADTAESCQHDKPVQLVAESGLISGSSLLAPGRCSWQIAVGRGQRVRLRADVFRPGSKSTADRGESDDAGSSCPWQLAVEGGEKALRIALCSRTNPRRPPLECAPRGTPQQWCSLLREWPEGFAHDESPVFVVRYEGIPH